MLWPGADFARGAITAVKWPFERIGWALERYLLWPVRDAFRAPEAAGRVALTAMLVTGLAVAGAGGVMISRGSDTSDPALPPAPKVAAAPATAVAPVKQQASNPTLQGAAPNFESSPAEAEAADAGAPAAEAAVTTPAGSDANAPASTIPAAAGGEQHALETARAFAAAFVLYEIDANSPKVRRTFARTATPALAKALGERPPRLPGEVNVPKARVVNVILGERQRQQIDASVSLLRLGNLSELRLTLTKDRKQGWAVSEVRG
ncbi:MAG: hypothetical protein AABM29_08165 [Actinomycetota bacterium]